MCGHQIRYWTIHPFIWHDQYFLIVKLIILWMNIQCFLHFAVVRFYIYTFDNWSGRFMNNVWIDFYDSDFKLPHPIPSLEAQNEFGERIHDMLWKQHSFSFLDNLNAFQNLGSSKHVIHTVYSLPYLKFHAIQFLSYAEWNIICHDIDPLRITTVKSYML